ncbi:MAG: hypothetical protein WC390_10345 [Sulfurimonas sp.]|jgi:hypothetical protein
MSDRYVTSIGAKKVGWYETAFLIHHDDNTLTTVKYKGTPRPYGFFSGKTFEEVLAENPCWTETTFEMCKHLLEVGDMLEGNAAVEAIAKYHKFGMGSPKSKSDNKPDNKSSRDWQTEIFKHIFS